MITLDDILHARSAIRESIEPTPCHLSRTLSGILGANVFLKFENQQFTASFKERGALNKLLSLTPQERERGVVAASAGNHAQGVAYHAARAGIRATIVMPETAPHREGQGRARLRRGGHPARAHASRGRGDACPNSWRTRGLHARSAL